MIPFFMISLSVFCLVRRFAVRNCCAGLILLLAPSYVRGASALFNFNTDPTASSLLTIYGNASWIPTDGAGSATNANDGYLEVTPSANNQRGAIVFAAGGVWACAAGEFAPDLHETLLPGETGSNLCSNPLAKRPFPRSSCGSIGSLV